MIAILAVDERERAYLLRSPVYPRGRVHVFVAGGSEYEALGFRASEIWITPQAVDHCLGSRVLVALKRNMAKTTRDGAVHYITGWSQ